MNKKLFLGMGTIASLIAPIVAVVSCGKDDAPKIGQTKEQTDKKAENTEHGTYQPLPGIATSGEVAIPQTYDQARLSFITKMEQLVKDFNIWESNFPDVNSKEHGQIEIDKLVINEIVTELNDREGFNLLSAAEKALLFKRVRDFEKHVQDLKNDLSSQVN